MRLLKALASATLSGLLLYLLIWYLVPRFFALPAGLSTAPVASSSLLARDGTPIANLPRPDLYRHQAVSLEEIPEDLLLATIAAEDKRFHDHGGIDFVAAARALRDNLSEREVVSGASTLTQQLIKLSSGMPPRTWKNKILEAFQARHLELSWSKREILEAYFNRLDYGSLRQGPDAAARYYFQKPLGQLSLAQCALLAGLPQAPSRHNPLRNPKSALQRRNWVLDRMHSVHAIHPERIDRAKAEPLELRPSKQVHFAAHLADLFRQHPQQGPLKTSIDADLQRFAESLVSRELARLSDHDAHHAAVLVVHNPSGEILALVGSGNHQNQIDGQLNGVFTKRSPGSTLKPFLYAHAFELGLSWPGHILPDIPHSFASTDGVTAPNNYDLRFHGPVSVRQALACSLNVAALHQLNEIGGAQTWMPFLESLGFAFHETASHYGLGLAIGNAEVPLIQLAQAYQILANKGIRRDLTLELQAPTSHSSPTPLISPESCFLITDILTDNLARAEAFGLNSPLKLPFPCAVKTGTSSDFRDNWCLGFTPTHTIAVWVGNFDHKPMRGISGISGAAPIFHQLMKRLGPGDRHFPAPPSTLSQCAIDPRTGRRYLGVPTVSNHSRNEWFHQQNPPLPIQQQDYDDLGRVLLDDRYIGWLRQNASISNENFALASDQRPSAPARITSPRNGAIFVLDPDIPGGTSRLRLQCNRRGVTWHAPTLEISDPNLLNLMPGTHQIEATLPNGERLYSIIEVKQL